MSTFVRRSLGAVTLLISAGAAAQAAPEGLAYRLGLGIEHSDNIARRPVAVADTVLSPSLGFAYVVQGASGEFEAAGTTSYRHYQQGRFGDEWLNQLGASGRWIFVPERLSWELQAAVSDQPINPFGTDAPDNRQRTEVINTGPTLALRPSTTTRVLAEFRYLKTGAERTPEFDGDRLAANVRGFLALNPRSTVSAELEGSDVRYDRVGATPDYRRENAFLKWAYQGRRGEWSANGGYSRARFDRPVSGNDRRVSIPLISIAAAYRIGELGRFEMQLDRGFGDSAQDLLDAVPRAEEFSLPIGRPVLRGGFVSGDLFKQTGGRFGFSRRDETLYLRFDGLWRRQEYLQSNGLDQTIRGFTVSANRQVRATFSLGAQAGVEWRSFGQASRRDRDMRVGMVANWQSSRRTGVSLDVSHGQRSSTDAQQVYDDNRAVLTFTLVR